MEINFEFTAAETPQQNGVVERAFATLYDKVRSMLNWADLEEKMRKKLWAKCVNLATSLDNITVNEESKKSPYDLLLGENPKFCVSLRVFGEDGIYRRTEIRSMKPKLDDRGVLCIFVGYSPEHAEGVYRMYNPETGQVRISRDIRWFNKNLKAYKATQGSGNLEAKFVRDSDDDEDKN